MKTGFISSLFANKETFQKAEGGEETNGLSYGNLTLEDLVTSDADKDGVPDWQEGLYGLDPSKKETTSGTPDSVAIEKIKKEQGFGVKNTDGKSAPVGEENLTETEKFSRELFATIAAGTQNGALDQTTIDQLSAALAEKVQNTQPRKVYSIFDLKTAKSDDAQAFKNYNDTLNDIYKKYPSVNYTVFDVLQKFSPDGENVDVNVLPRLDPIITDTQRVITAMLKTSVPPSISALHLAVINSEERIMENISDIRVYDNDPILALGGVTKYQENANLLESDLTKLAYAIVQKLK